MDFFQNTVSSGGNYVNLAAAAMLQDGWLVSASEASAMYTKKALIFVPALILFYLASSSNTRETVNQTK